MQDNTDCAFYSVEMLAYMLLCNRDILQSDARCTSEQQVSQTSNKTTDQFIYSNI